MTDDNEALGTIERETEQLQDGTILTLTLRSPRRRRYRAS